MRTYFLAIFLLASSVSVKANDDEKAFAKADLNGVTVYRLGAELQQNFKVAVKTQTQFIEVTNVSSSLEKNSLQIKTNDNVTILGFEFYNSYLNEEIKTPEYKRIEDSLQKVKKEISKLNSNSSTLKDLLVVLGSNKEMKGTQTGLSVTELAKLMDYYKQKSNELKNDIADVDEQIAKLNETSKKLNAQLDEERKRNTDKGGKLVIQIACNFAGTYNFAINYLTQNASWTPFYDIKTANTHSPFNLIYKAKIVQTTGIDWKQIKLNLSTALPNEFGNAPVLKTWFLQYVEPGASPLFRRRAVGIQAQSQELNDVVVVGYGNKSVDEDDKMTQFVEPIYVVNGNIVSKEEYKNIAPQAIKSINTLKDNEATALYGSRASGGAIVITLKDELSDYVSVQDNTVSTVYNIDIPLDISTNGKEQVATLQTKQVNATYTYYSIPKLNESVYLLARVPDWSKLNLLDGDANLFFEDTYVGKTNISSTSVSDTFNLTIATDKRIFVQREKLKNFSSTQFLSSYKKQFFTYEITVKNTKNEAADITVKDQYPISSNKEVEVELLENSNAAVNKETGELEWKIQLNANEQKKIRFQYSIKYPKDKQLNL